jgi:hypothetical protein
MTAPQNPRSAGVLAGKRRLRRRGAASAPRPTPMRRRHAGEDAGAPCTYGRR